LPAIATALTGVLTGEFLKSRKSDYEKVSWMFVTGLAAMVAGTILDMWFPINKNLWSPSYVVFTSGMALVFLAACYFLIDIKNFKKAGKPFVVFGMNALALFFLSGLVGRIIMLLQVGQGSGAVNLKAFIYQAAFASWAGDMNGSLFFAIAYIFFWFLILLWMYKRKIFVKI
jgi:predicted acyltransferase